MLLPQGIPMEFRNSLAVLLSYRQQTFPKTPPYILVEAFSSFLVKKLQNKHISKLIFKKHRFISKAIPGYSFTFIIQPEKFTQVEVANLSQEAEVILLA
jgi:hypothetical protein